MTEASSSLEIRLTAADDISMLLGSHDKHVKLIEEMTETTIHTRGEMIQIIGEEPGLSLAQSVIRTLQELIKRGIHVSTPDVVTALKMGQKGHWITSLKCMKKKSSKTAMVNRFE